MSSNQEELVKEVTELDKEDTNSYLGQWSGVTHQYQRHSDDGQPHQRGFPPAHLVTHGAKQVCPDQVGDGGRQEGRAQLPLLAAHLLHHVQRQAGLQHRDTHVGEGDGPSTHQDVGVSYQGLEAWRWFIGLDHL